jgi:hypothetical protein
VRLPITSTLSTIRPVLARRSPRAGFLGMR